MRNLFLCLLPLLIGCPPSGDKDSGGESTPTGSTDQDGDGWTVEDDCDDQDATVNPEETEVPYNGLDDDCDPGSADDDVDEDGFLDADDCDDADAALNPGEEEVCDGADNNCDGTADEGLTGTAWLDEDGDSFGGSATSEDYCGAPSEGYSLDNSDCDDANAAVSPGATEVCDNIDNNCDGEVNEGEPELVTYYPDADLDGYGDAAGTPVEACEIPEGYVADAGDCNDADAAVSPAAAELCDEADWNCDGDPTAGATDGTAWYADADGDGFGDESALTTSCTDVAGSVTVGGDCDDASSDVSPAATETCNGGVDDDCNGVADDETAVGVTTWYADADGDGFGDAASTTLACNLPADYSASADDCDDNDAAVNPGAAEVCNGGIDDNCNGTWDAEDETISDLGTFYADGDEDGYGDDATAYPACEPLAAGDVAVGGDCDDADATLNPGVVWYADVDADGSGDVTNTLAYCGQPEGYVADMFDCDDADAGAYPEAPESCDGIDHDCDGLTNEDESEDATAGYADADADGYGEDASMVTMCTLPAGYAIVGGDCNDVDATAYPGADEYCDGYDDDCDGEVDEAGSIGETAWYEDVDADGYGATEEMVMACDLPAGYSDLDEDCDDGDGAVYPGAAEVDQGDGGDPIDDDCDGWADEDFVTAGAVVINEIARQTEFGTGSVVADGQWFEIYNPSSTRTLDLSNWYVFREDDATGTTGGFHLASGDAIIMGPKAYVVVCAKDDYSDEQSAASDLTCDYFWSDDSEFAGASGYEFDNTMELQVAEDNLQIYQAGDEATGVLVDAVHWYDGSGGSTPWEGDEGKSIELVPAAYTNASGPNVLNDDAAYWSPAKTAGTKWYGASTPSSNDDELGTPGAVNGAL